MGGGGRWACHGFSRLQVYKRFVNEIDSVPRMVRFRREIRLKNVFGKQMVAGAR